MFNTYVINMEKDKDRLDRTINEFKKSDISYLERFDAINVNNYDLRNDKTVTKKCRHYCTNKIIGCALSHIFLARSLLQNAYSQDFALIVEDDIKIKYPKTLQHDILKFVDTLNYKDWDIILLFCQGWCPNVGNKKQKYSPLPAGSAAAYLISQNGLKKMSNLKVSYHFDIIIHYYFNVYNGPELFTTYDKSYSNPILDLKIKNQNVGFWINQDFFYIPYLKINIKFIHVIFIFWIICFILNKDIFK